MLRTEFGFPFLRQLSARRRRLNCGGEAVKDVMWTLCRALSMHLGFHLRDGLIHDWSIEGWFSPTNLLQSSNNIFQLEQWIQSTSAVLVGESVEVLDCFAKEMCHKCKGIFAVAELATLDSCLDASRIRSGKLQKFLVRRLSKVHFSRFYRKEGKDCSLNM